MSLRKTFAGIAFLAAAALLAGCSGDGAAPPEPSAAPGGAAVRPAESPAPSEPAAAAPAKETPTMPASPASPSPAGREIATFGAGCFWCVEAVLEKQEGVLDVKSGYMGGQVENPTYRQVCNGDTNHAEVVQVTFDPAKISYDALLDWFWRLHDPTTLNRQGMDAGTQYRSAIFFHSEEQRAAAERSKKAAQASFEDPIVTEITAAGPFYEAEDYHQDYYRENGAQPYCQAVIRPKMKKLGLEK